MKVSRIIARLLYTIPIMLGVAIIVFMFVRLTPGDPVDVIMGQSGSISAGEMEQIRKEFHLDKPLIAQLQIFLSDAARGDLGYSYLQKQPVSTLIADRLPATIELAGAALFIALVAAVPIGLIAAVRRNRLTDRVSMGAAFLGMSMPGFWLGIVLILIFSVKLRWLPVQGRIAADVMLSHITGFYLLDSVLTGNWVAFRSSFMHLVLPAITLGAPLAAVVARVLRSSMVEALRSDYVTLARAKGARESRVVVKHALRNALIPTVTVVGLQFGVLLGGNLIIETVFGWPGLGRLVVGAIFSRDFPLIQGTVLVYAFTFVIANLLVDVSYTYLNPKVTL